MRDKEAVAAFLESAGQFERIVNESGFVKLTRLTNDAPPHEKKPAAFHSTTGFFFNDELKMTNYGRDAINRVSTIWQDGKKNSGQNPSCPP